MEKLKRCPFCGNENIDVQEYDPYDGYQGNLTTYRVRCTNCGANIAKVNKEDAVEKWNARADADEVRHGGWHYNPDGMDWGLGAWECSLCRCRNDNLPMDEKINPRVWAGTKFCPNCGAKMDGVVKRG